MVRNCSKQTLEDFESKNGIFFMFQLERLFENRHRDEDDDRHLLQMAEREEWWILIGEFRNDATKLLQFPSVMRQHAKKNMCLSNLYFFFQEDFSSSLSLVVRGSCLLIMQITGKSLIFVEILHKEKILLLDMMIHTVAKH